jgi:hypothetical protein
MERRTLAVAVYTWIALAAPAWAIPSSITYQGSLKEKGLPATGTKNMLFRITNSDGSQVYWSSGNLTVTVNNGLFSARISPTGVDWENVIPYIEVSVEGQLLQPREPVGASAYALMCQSVANEKGMIAMFETACPSGWNVYSKLQGRFPVGADSTQNFTVGSSGGSLTHNHGGQTTVAVRGGSHLVSTPDGAPAGEYLEDAINEFIERASGHTHSIAPDSSLPPYLTMVFCQKL